MCNKSVLDNSFLYVSFNSVHKKERLKLSFQEAAKTGQPFRSIVTYNHFLSDYRLHKLAVFVCKTKQNLKHHPPPLYRLQHTDTPSPHQYVRNGTLLPYTGWWISNMYSSTFSYMKFLFSSHVFLRSCCDQHLPNMDSSNFLDGSQYTCLIPIQQHEHVYHLYMFNLWSRWNIIEYNCAIMPFISFSLKDGSMDSDWNFP